MLLLPCKSNPSPIYKINPIQYIIVADSYLLSHLYKGYIPQNTTAQKYRSIYAHRAKSKQEVKYARIIYDDIYPPKRVESCLNNFLAKFYTVIVGNRSSSSFLNLLYNLVSCICTSTLAKYLRKRYCLQVKTKNLPRLCARFPNR